MFFEILKFELRYYLKQVSVYSYLFSFLFVSTALAAGTAGYFDGTLSVTGPFAYLNSAIEIFKALDFFKLFILFLIPALVAHSSYRDFKTNTYQLLYSYPIHKRDYLFAKFISSFLISLFIIGTIALGIFLASQLPGIDKRQFADFNVWAYFDVYFLFAIPNALYLALFVFAISTYSRTIYPAFIAVILIFLFPKILAAFLATEKSMDLFLLLDPFGSSSVLYESRFWSLAERNLNSLPISSILIANRVFWLLISSLFAFIFYRHFELVHENKPLFQKKEKHKKQKEEKKVQTSIRDVHFVYSFSQNLKTIWALSRIDFASILKNRMFQLLVLAALAFIFFQQAQLRPQYGFSLLPVSWKMLRVPSFLFVGIINILSFLYAGILCHQAKQNRMSELIDSSPVENKVLLLSKLLALFKMQLFLLSLLIFSGISVQLLNGFTDVHITQYLYESFVLNFLNTALWACVAIFIQSLVSNPYFGLFLLLGFFMGQGLLPKIGITDPIFQYNSASNDGIAYQYSDLNAYGDALSAYFAYKTYWFFAALIILILTSLFWLRGRTDRFRERFLFFRERLNWKFFISFVFLWACFLSMGFYLYKENNRDDRFTAEKRALFTKKVKENYQKFLSFNQPKIQSVYIEMDIYPKKRSFTATGFYELVNESEQAIDTIIISRGFDEETSYRLNRNYDYLIQDELVRFDVLRLHQPLKPKSRLRMDFTIRSKENSMLLRNSNVLENGTFLQADIFPRFAFSRMKEELKEPSDPKSQKEAYQSKDADFVDFEAKLSTSDDQIAITAGDLKRSWKENGRAYFHYKMPRKLKFDFAFSSGRYELKKEVWKGFELSAYYHKSHNYNIDDMLSGLKKSLEYNSHYFGDFHQKGAQIIEFPLSEGSFATTFANCFPYSEYRFIAKVDRENKEAINLPFYVSAHEMAHQWWGSQLVPARALGSRMLTESLCEYVSLQILKREYGNAALYRFLKLNRKQYLKGRLRKNKKERALIYTDGSQYIAYRKAAILFTSLSDFIGEENLNRALRKFIDNFRFKKAPYATSLDLISFIYEETPDSLAYLIHDNFEQVSFYENRILKAEAKFDGENYLLESEFLVSKYYGDENGRKIFRSVEGDSLHYEGREKKEKISSLPLADYIELAVFDEEGEILYQKMHNATGIYNRIKLSLSKKPKRIVIDPFLKGIEENIKNNTMDVHLLQRKSPK